MQNYWQIQNPNKPLFPEILWEKPEQRDLAGSLLITGGCAQSLHNVSACYQQTIKSFIGRCDVLLPESLRKITESLPGIIYAPSNQIGSFSRASLGLMMYASANHDATLLVGDFGKNSETAVVLSDFVHNSNNSLVIANDAVDILFPDTSFLLKRPDTYLILNYKQLQKLATENKELFAFSHELSLMQIVKMIHEFTSKISAMLIIKFEDQLIIGDDGKVITTQRSDLKSDWNNILAANGAVNIVQHPQKKFKAFATACLS